MFNLILFKWDKTQNAKEASMNAFFKYSLVALAVAGLSACNQDKAVAEPTAVVEEVVLTTPEQKEAYGIGAFIGADVAKNITAQQELGVDIDQALLVQGFTDAVANNAKLSEEELMNIMQGFQQKLQEKYIAQQEAQAKEAEAASAAFLAENGKKAGVTTTDSGLQYEVLTEGTGDKPKATDTVKVHYKGTLTDGTEFDSSYSRGEPISFPLDRVIAGWTEGVQLMPVGSKYKFVIPAELAYGDRDTGSIPANSTLVFEVELLDIEKPAEVK